MLSPGLARTRFRPSAHRAGRGLDQLHDAQAEPAVGLRHLAVLDAIDEMLALDAQRLGARELRRPHVAGPVADAHLVDLLRVVGEADALVVDLDLLARLEVVVDDHLLAAADQDLAHLHRRQPAHVDVRDRARVIEQRDVRQVLGRAREVIDAARRNRDRMLAQQVVEDREVVHGQVRDHVDVALEQAQVDPDRVVVVDAPEVAALDDLGHLAHRAGVDEGVIDEQHALAPLGFVDQLAGLKRGLRHRLLEPQMLAGLEGRHAELEVGADGRGDRDRRRWPGRRADPGSGWSSSRPDSGA